MAVRLNPCWGCKLRHGCKLHDEWRKKVSGLGLRNACFTCPTLAAEIRPGRRVIIKVPVCVGTYNVYADCECGYRYGSREVKATVTTSDPQKHTFACVVDPGELTEDDLFSENASVDGVRFRRTQNHWRIVRFLEEPDMEICVLGNVVRDGKCDTKDQNWQCFCKKDGNIPEEHEW